MTAGDFKQFFFFFSPCFKNQVSVNVISHMLGRLIAQLVPILFGKVKLQFCYNFPNTR